MFNKKGYNFGFMVGALTWAVVFGFSLIILISCSALTSDKTHARVIESSNEIDKINDLNHFLEIPFDQDNNVIDSIIDSYYSKNFDDRFSAKTEEYFSRKHSNWRLVIFDEDDDILYERDFDLGISSVLAQSEVTIPILEDDSKSLTIVFQVGIELEST